VRELRFPLPCPKLGFSALDIGIGHILPHDILPPTPFIFHPLLETTCRIHWKSIQEIIIGNIPLDEFYNFNQEILNEGFGS